MLFNSLPFLFLFLPITYFVFWKLSSRDARYFWLALTGYLFYSFWNYKFCALMAFSTLVSFLGGLGLQRWPEKCWKRKLSLALPITLDLLLLGFFKYVNFVIDTANNIAATMGADWAAKSINIILPVGISFYTFHTISYVVDCYRGVVKPTRNLLEFACYVSLFPQLVAGPIVRFRQIEADLEDIDRSKGAGQLDLGWSYFTLGMIEKVLIADSIALIINPALENYRELSTISAWLCVLGYTYQLYFDFLGYSDMAVGLGHLFGLRIPQNFNSPYKATDISDFWRRWHISLSTCLRDYLYIPLGGNRVSPFRTRLNLMLTMLFGGLWHGASWTFVFWGGYHGALLMCLQYFDKRWQSFHVNLRRVFTFLVVIIGWVFFRSDSFGMALALLAKMFIWESGKMMPGIGFLSVLLAVAAYFAHVASNSWEISHEWSGREILFLTVMFVVCLLVIVGGKATPFLYFQF
ncbi:MAG: MBOAT family protein [Candidatus Riflebacteria bacterium]|nr:MBOAT family protein [Candidatus Riflebacteria bacterium]